MLRQFVGSVFCLLLLMMPSLVTAQSVDESLVLTIVNQERALVGASPLTFDSCLATAAQVHNNDMIANSFFDHTSPTDSSTPAIRAATAGNPSTFVGENIAAGQTTATSVMSAWMGSSGHQANILNTGFTHIGISRVNNHWTQVFGNAACSGGSSTTGSSTGGGSSTTGSSTGGGSSTTGSSTGGGSSTTGSSTGGNSSSNASSSNNSQSNGVTVATVDTGLCGANITISGAVNGVACRVLGVGGVGNQVVIDMGLLYAVDISGNINGQLTVCLQGIGNMVFLDARGIPRVPASIASYTGINGTTCATISSAGTLALVGGQSTPSVITAPTAPIVNPNPQPIFTGNSLIHVVQTGENLFRIGLRYGVPFQELAVINGIDSRYRIYVGQQIIIPAR